MRRARQHFAREGKHCLVVLPQAKTRGCWQFKPLGIVVDELALGFQAHLGHKQLWRGHLASSCRGLDNQGLLQTWCAHQSKGTRNYSDLQDDSSMRYSDTLSLGLLESDEAIPVEVRFIKEPARSACCSDSAPSPDSISGADRCHLSTALTWTPRLFQ